MPIIESTRAVTRWTSRTIPVFLVGAVSYSTYVVVDRVCSSYLINKRAELGPAIVILVLYFILLILMVGTYLRAVTTVLLDPGVVPLGPQAIEQRKRERENRKHGYQGHDLESRPYYNGSVDTNPDSPGLENFYTKDVFVCEDDGKPKWCSQCSNWKPDRAHHSSEIDRCVLRMDHYCPWVGGMIGENSFKFFVQFVTYTACYCAVVLGSAASSLHKQINEGSQLDPHFIPVIVLASFFGLFTFLMTVTSVRYIFLNMTNVDILGSQRKVHQLAVHVPRGTEATDRYSIITYPLPKPEEETNGHSNDTARPRSVESRGVSPQPNRFSPSSRDDLANRTFAILKTEPGENPWDLGMWKNWQSVMGTNVLDWILPFRRSPLVNHESHDSFYPMGQVLVDMRARYNLHDLAIGSGGLEMKELRRGNRS
ncbi:zf-DHHC-domain-containing protein [Rostrohypoxylon terebratum]|nr:zf-DHHC-domain-containing protein [Rostrohypoxylon terebratum]